MAKGQIKVHDKVFRSKTGAMSYAKAILHKYAPDESVVGEDLLFMSEYIKEHYHAKYLTAWLETGTLNIELDPYGTTCFSITTAEGERKRFSYRKFKTPDTKLKIFKMCARRAISKEVTALSMSSGVIGKKTHHVDHAGAWTFERIVSAFITDTTLDVDSLIFSECDFGTALPDQLADQFRQYHNERAQLTIMNITEHKKKHEAKSK